MKLHYRAVRCCHHLYVLGPCLKHVWKLHIGKRQSAWKKRQICYPSQCLQICLFICLELAPKEKVVMRILAAPQCNRPSPKFSSVLTLEYVKSGLHLIWEAETNFLFWWIIFDILKFILGSETWGNQTKEVYYLLLSLKMISFVLFPQASQPSVNIK